MVCSNNSKTRVLWHFRRDVPKIKTSNTLWVRLLSQWWNHLCYHSAHICLHFHETTAGLPKIQVCSFVAFSHITYLVSESILAPGGPQSLCSVFMNCLIMCRECFQGADGLRDSSFQDSTFFMFSKIGTAFSSACVQFSLSHSLSLLYIFHFLHFFKDYS